jgi:Fe-S cluster biosynthesis and repair protein YggX
VPYAGELGAEIREKTCIDCWAEWQQAEVMIINELRLDFMNAKSLDILTQHLREFLGLDSASPTDP